MLAVSSTHTHTHTHTQKEERRGEHDEVIKRRGEEVISGVSQSQGCFLGRIGPSESFEVGSFRGQEVRGQVLQRLDKTVSVCVIEKGPAFKLHVTYLIGSGPCA